MCFIRVGSGEIWAVERRIAIARTATLTYIGYADVLKGLREKFVPKGVLLLLRAVETLGGRSFGSRGSSGLGFMVVFLGRSGLGFMVVA